MPTTKNQLDKTDWLKHFDELPLPMYVDELRKEIAFPAEDVEVSYTINGDEPTITMTTIELRDKAVEKTDKVREIKVKEKS